MGATQLSDFQRPGSRAGVISRSLDKIALTLAEVAILLNAETQHQSELIKEGARELKRKIYGNRGCSLPHSMLATNARTIVPTGFRFQQEASAKDADR